MDWRLDPNDYKQTHELKTHYINGILKIQFCDNNPNFYVIYLLQLK